MNVSTHHLSQESNPILGIGLCLLAYFFVTMFGLCEKLISHSVTVPAIIFCQNLICLVLIIPQLMKSGIQTFATRHWQLYVIRIGSGIGCYACLFFLLRKLPISEAFLYQYSASLWIPFVMLAWLSIPIKRDVWYGIIIGFAGICLILKPTDTTVGLISIIGLICSLFQAISVVAIRRLTAVEPIARILFYYFLTTTLIAGIVAFRHGVSIQATDIKWLAGVGIFAFLGQQFLAASLKHASASTLAPICYTTLLYSGIFDWIIWHQVPERATLLGMLLVMTGCLITLTLSKRKFVTSVSVLTVATEKA